MGYTHYWYRQPTLDVQKFEAWTQDVQRVLEHLPKHSLSAGGYCAEQPLTIHNWNGEEEPEITRTCVSFNGDRALELDHETFFIEQVFQPESWQRQEADGTYFAFCKTARKPYDLLVTAALIRLKYHFPEVSISSDGSPKDWIEGLKLCTQVFGSAQLPLTEETEEAEA